ncbi:hypothetical protein SAMN02982929_03977 [Saccharopolyspora kobensis]|uniref:Uncharacterized protein n=1 Tax=Saccharopolyspora kobensis TaxID=146035 RepID=A0A1H6D4H0_9PSEU|nr:DUF6506 family protein [Saccharopolyspora kobensis]SEG80249.1 hypothetical protein SAMN02982929_03977 [Saccharopolyspora kobensis]SFD11284.1 hypothetical protein SAMN05216506_102572 [Saccharopolyspora kobensis]
MEPIDTMFVFLAPGAERAGQRIEQQVTGGVNAFVWVPDAEAAAEVVAAQAAAGLELVELYRGFSLREARLVVDAVDGRAPVGVSGFAFAAGAGEVRNSATIYGADLDDPGARRVDVEVDGKRTSVVPVADAEGAVAAAVEAVAAGADVVEICGGTPLTTAARVEQELAGRAVVGLVSWPFEALPGAAAYRAAFEAR